MTFSSGDRAKERERYDNRAAKVPSSASTYTSLAPYLESPYFAYENVLRREMEPDLVVVELCSGLGEYSRVINEAGCTTILLDISLNSLSFCRDNVYPGAHYVGADIGHIPIGSGSVDVICCAGGLSYCDHDSLLGEVYRILRPGGKFVCIDVLDESWVYRANRYVNFAKGKRSRSVINNAPSLKFFERVQNRFVVSTWFFNYHAWVWFLLSGLDGRLATCCCIILDLIFGKRHKAFKFVMKAVKR